MSEADGQPPPHDRADRQPPRDAAGDQPGAAEPAAAQPVADTPADQQPAAASGQEQPQRFNPTRVVTVVLLALLGFTFTVQVRSVAEDPTVAALGQEDLVRILRNLDDHEDRLRRDISELEETHRRLTTAGQDQQEALAEAARRADELGVLAGTLPVEGPGVEVTFRGGAEAVPAARILDAVQELRSAGAEAMQIGGADGPVVRIVASSYFIDGADGLVVDGQVLRAPYTLTVIGEPATLAPALRIPGGVVESVQRDGGTVTVQEQPGGVEVSAVRDRIVLQHARPDS